MKIELVDIDVSDDLGSEIAKVIGDVDGFRDWPTDESMLGDWFLQKTTDDYGEFVSSGLVFAPVQS